MEIEELFNKLDQLPSIPKVVQELIQTFNNDEADIIEIAKKISMDQVISAKVIRLVNSAHYCRGSEVVSIEDAVIRLGFNTVRTLVMASGISGAFSHLEGFDQNEFWGNTFRIACIAKWLAKQTENSPETAFTCAMLHNLGEMLIHVSVPDTAVQIDTAVREGANRIEWEEKILGFNYALVGAVLARRWKFNDSFVNSIRDHIDPLAYAEFNENAGFIALAMFFNSAWKNQLTEEDIEEQYPKALAMRLGVSFTETLDKKDKMLEESKSMVDLLSN